MILKDPAADMDLTTVLSHKLMLRAGHLCI